MKSASFGLSLVLLVSMLAMACGSSRTPKVQSTEFSDTNAAPFVRNKTGILNCDTRDEKPAVGTELIKVQGEAHERIVTLDCKGGNSGTRLEIGRVDFDIPQVSRQADILEMRNRTTCSEFKRTWSEDDVNVQGMGIQSSAPIQSLHQIAVLPRGQALFETPSEFSLDAARPNVLEVFFKQCTDRQNGVCLKSKLVETRSFVVVVNVTPGKARDSRVEAAQSCSTP